MAATRCNTNGVEAGGVVIVSEGVLRGVLEGDDPDWLVTHATRSRIVILPISLREALANAEDVTASGIHGLARLLAVGDFRKNPAEETGVDGAGAIGHFTADALLSCLIGRPETTADWPIKLRSLRAEGVELVTRDADLVAALLCVRDSDSICTARLSEVLALVTLVHTSSRLAERKVWHEIRDEFVDEIRAKALSRGARELSSRER